MGNDKKAILAEIKDYALIFQENFDYDIIENELFNFLETNIIRRMVVHANTKNDNQLFTDRLINNQILSKEQFMSYLEGQADKVNFLPTNEKLKNGFDTAQLINKQSAGILYFIESKIRNRSLQSTTL